MLEELDPFMQDDGTNPENEFYLDGNLDPTSEKFEEFFDPDINPFRVH